MKQNSPLKNVFTSFGKIFFIFALCGNAWAVDIIKMNEGESDVLDKRSEHKTEVIYRALELTVPEYGPYEFKKLINSMNRTRALYEIISGKYINIYVSAASTEWDNKTIAIKIPIRMGLLNYRLLLIHKNDLETFSQVTTLDDLKKLTAGVRDGWVTTEAFQIVGLPINKIHNFEGLFTLLNNHRFDYIPRAIYEIFDELKARKDLLDNVVVEPTIALHLPMPTYVYVSKKAPHIAQRIEKGLKIMIENGELEQILTKYYADDIKRANIKNRRIIEIDNPFFTDQELLKDKNLWYLK